MGSHGGVAGSLSYTKVAATMSQKTTGTGKLVINATTGTATVTLSQSTTETLDDGTTATTKEFVVGNTTYILVESTAAKTGYDTKSSVKEAAEELTKKDNKQGFTSMDALMSAIKRDYRDRKSVV